MKKYVANWEGKEMILTKKDYKTLLKRFDIKKFRLINGYHVNNVTCPLCEKFIDNQCNGCTFNKFYGSSHSFGCIGILKQISKEIKSNNQHLNLCVNNINFSSNHLDENSKFIIYIGELLSTKFQLVVRKK